MPRYGRRPRSPRRGRRGAPPRARSGHRSRAGKRGGCVCGGEAERARCSAERRQSLEHGPRPADGELDREVQADGDRAEGPARIQSSPLSGSRKAITIRSRARRRRTLRSCQPLSHRLGAGAVESGAHRVEHAAVEALKHRRRIRSGGASDPERLRGCARISPWLRSPTG